MTRNLCSVMETSLKRCFNPCFSGSCSESKRAGFRNRTSLYVSILVLVDHALKVLVLERAPICTGMDLVSILVLVDHALKDLRTCGWMHSGRVSILVLVDHALKAGLHLYPKHLEWVSILVLVDHALKVNSGSNHVARMRVVSILVLVDHALKEIKVAMRTCDPEEFQSLF